jgi:hypothetical protein
LEKKIRICERKIGWNIHIKIIKNAKKQYYYINKNVSLLPLCYQSIQIIPFYVLSKITFVPLQEHFASKPVVHWAQAPVKA